MPIFAWGTDEMTPAIFRLFTTISQRTMIRYGNPTCFTDVFYLYSIGASNKETMQRVISNILI